MGFLSLTSWQFAAAGAVCAAGPIVIHLLNRRRYRVVKWAAMDFLRQAIQRNRRILQIRDLILLLLRTAAVLLFGLALARPYFARRQQQFDERQPLHAVIVIDNSLSMGYASLEGTLLDQAKLRARELIEKLPSGSRVSVIPACGTREALRVDPYDSKDAAVEAVGRIEAVDRSAGLQIVGNEARRACEAVPELAKRIVFIGDQQALNWQGIRESEALASLPPMQIVSVSAGVWENSWISDLRVQDGLADIETPAVVIVELAHQGSSPRRDVQVTLSMGQTVIGQKTVTLEPGLGKREVDFECTFSALAELPEPGKPILVPIRAAISPDRLAADDERFLAVPVVAALPVVFVDQYGPDEEDVARGRLGETRHLRKLLAPRTSRSDAPRQLISVRHLTPDRLTREALADARLVVVAGLREPGEMTPLLAEYVRQGGQLVLAAGADFDPVAWTDAAWLDGEGILPLPLKREPIGEVPEVAGPRLRPFFLSVDELVGEAFFQVAGMGERELKDLYAEPFFFKAVEADASPPVQEALQLQAKAKKNETSAGTQAGKWLVWARGEEDGDAAKADPAEFAPRVVGRYALPNQPPFLVARRMGRGEVVFCTTGLLSSWNTLPKTSAVLIFDRILRGMIENTLPRRNLAPADYYSVPLPAEEQHLQVTLHRPGKETEEPLDVSYIAADRRGVTITGLLTRGVYRVAGSRPNGDASGAARRVWETSLVVGGSAAESDLTPLARRQFDAVARGDELRWVSAGEEISLAGAAIRGQSSWWWLVLVVLALLFLEMSVLIWPVLPVAATPPVGERPA